MPELPEVETTRRGIMPYLEHQTIQRIDCRIEKLRRPLDLHRIKQMQGRRVSELTRRGKYLLISFYDTNLVLLIHLGMSGSLRICTTQDEIKKHDHIIIHLENKKQIRFHDPRRFGCFDMMNSIEISTFLTKLGVEPLSEKFTVEYLYQTTRNKQQTIKSHIMNQQVVVGVGNIYATEALFLSGIRPDRHSKTLKKAEIKALVQYIKQELSRAIALGGTTLRDFTSPDGTNGYFQQTLQVYGRLGLPCYQCDSIIENKVINNRTSAYCPHCQK